MVTLLNTDEFGKTLQATFTPHRGMNLTSYSRDGLEVIDQNTLPLFEERNAGLGAIIGPHFHHQKNELSHGIGRYAAWDYVASTTQIQAKLKSDMTWRNKQLREYEGFDFEMHIDVRLLPNGLVYHYLVESEKPSVIGLHTYYTLTQNSRVKIDHDIYELDRAYDNSIIPTLHEHWYRAMLVTQTHTMHITFLPESESEYSFQLYHPEGATFACIEPLSARNPRKPKLTRSSLEIRLEIL